MDEKILKKINEEFIKMFKDSFNMIENENIFDNDCITVNEDNTFDLISKEIKQLNQIKINLKSVSVDKNGQIKGNLIINEHPFGTFEIL